ncbi:hypothetical protein DICVIV_00743 [Dictyocaulus viviparus]|uniref:Uncharacterized protein n=1 Tax=Dictyocaulus viviparus TaxID=29172 RepID=A0A0D8Y874_DICVI|nr:hypothetical protein DICVIV_00743 [Dictyocaulus viviparus]
MCLNRRSIEILILIADSWQLAFKINYNTILILFPLIKGVKQKWSECPATIKHRKHINRNKKSLQILLNRDKSVSTSTDSSEMPKGTRLMDVNKRKSTIIAAALEEECKSVSGRRLLRTTTPTMIYDFESVSDDVVTDGGRTGNGRAQLVAFSSTMFGRRKVAPCCAIVGAWMLITLYFFSRSGLLLNNHSLLRDDESNPQQLQYSSNTKSLNVNVFDVDEYKKAGNDINDNINLNGDGLKVEVQNDKSPTNEQSGGKPPAVDEQIKNVVPPAVIVPIEHEPAVDLDKLAILTSPEDEASRDVAIRLLYKRHPAIDLTL